MAASLIAGSALAQMKQQPRPAAPVKQGNGNMAVSVGGQAGVQLEAAKISIEEAAKLQKAGKAVLIDVRSNDQFALGHIKGALSIPGSQLIARIREVPAGKMIITYCACSAEQSSAHAVQDLNAHGIKNAAALVGGWHGWQEAKLPTAIGRK
jgi:rhodanese-related sulfurtransferase